MRPLFDLDTKQDRLRMKLEQQMEGKKLDDQDFNHFIIQAYKLSKRKEAALDDLNEVGVDIFSPDEIDPRTVDLKSKLLNKHNKE